VGQATYFFDKTRKRIGSFLVERHKTLSEYQSIGPKVRVGADIDAWCTRCRMVLTHTIIAMAAGEPVKVQCNTCASSHKFKAQAPGQTKARSPRKASGTWAPAPAKRPEKAWLNASTGKNLSNPIAYHPKSTFEVDQVIMHGKFGTGIVMGVKNDGKIIVTFHDSTRVLVHGRG
jgi:hypothetical protein